MAFIILFKLILLLLVPLSASGAVFPYESNKTLYGHVVLHKILKNESLVEIARKYGLGFNEIQDANPDLDPLIPPEGVTVAVPTFWILPDTRPTNGIVINLSEMRLYYYYAKTRNRYLMTAPIGIGSEGTDTPVGKFTVIEKKIKPSWYPPASILKERPHLPKVVPPGPENPLGSHAMRLSLSTVLIHGTHRPWGVGRRVSHGCIRLYPEDIPRLFTIVPVGTEVTIIRQPIKVSAHQGKVYMEVHADDSLKNINYYNESVKLLRQKNLLSSVKTERLYVAIKEKRGMPVLVSQ